VIVQGLAATPLTDAQRAALEIIARQAADLVALRGDPEDRFLADSRNFLDAVIDNLPVALFCKDLQTGYSICLWNKRSEQLFGLAKAEILGKNDYELFPREQADFFRAKDLETMRDGKALEVLEEPIDSPAYGRRYLHTTKVPVRDKDGNFRYLLGISDDITERRDNERLIAEQQMQIIRSAKFSSLGEMAGGIAHEINNPLAIIHGKAAQLRAYADKGQIDARKVRDFSEKIEATAWRISKIIRGLRSFARNADLDPFERVRLSSILDDTLELCCERFKNNGIELRIGAVPEVELSCRPAQISQVLLNLLNNAYDAVLDKPERWVEIWIEHKENSVRVSVTDSGTGIPAEIAEKIMQPFFTTKDVGKGTGLGLSISKGIIDDHRGALRLETGSARTRFCIELPCAPLAGQGRAA
jgi:PAS domain S-box-containing protein